MTIQEKLAQRIYELLPHKKELEFGCTFWIYSGDHKKKLHCYMVSDTHYALKEYKTSNNYIWEINKEQILSSGGEIIGQPLRLADLLMAIEITNSDYSKSNRPYNIHLDFQATWIEGKHLLITHALGDPILNKEGQYNLSKDNILDQSDDLCSFCLELLK